MHEGSFSHSRGQGRDLAGSKVVKYCSDSCHAISIGSDRVNGSEWRFRIYEYLESSLVETEPEFSIPSQRLGHVTPNVAYLAKSASIFSGSD